jgi:hypothetical protein
VEQDCGISKQAKRLTGGCPEPILRNRLERQAASVERLELTGWTERSGSDE